jgi:hypothetical protein
MDKTHSTSKLAACSTERVPVAMLDLPARSHHATLSYVGLGRARPREGTSI